MNVSKISAARTFAAMSILVVALGCGLANAIPPGAVTTVVSLQKVDCAECGARIVQELKARQGVYAASFDKRKVELTVIAGASFDAFGAVRALAVTEGFNAVAGAGAGSYVPQERFSPQADMKVVAEDGTDVPDLRSVLVSGKVTVVDFFAVWCEPCRKVDEHMVTVLANRGDVAYRKLDVGDWDTPLAQRYLKNVPSLPYVLVFDRAGERMDAVAGLDLAKLDAAIARGTR
jgi:thiol-disulfide isomerase/thioredoxin